MWLQQFKTLVNWQKWLTRRKNVYKKKKCLQKKWKAFQFCMIKELKVLLRKSSQKFRFCRKPLKQVATENILKIAVMKQLVPCSVSKILTKY